MSAEHAGLRIYDSATRKKRLFQPLVPNQVGIYVCGPTVYDDCHIGHARCYVAFDVVVRYLRFLGYEVRYVRNLTDIDDKILQRARDENQDPLALAEHFGARFCEDMVALGNRPPTHSPKVSDHLSEIIALIEQLLAGGYAYEVHGDVYFEVERFDDYGRLSGRNLDDLRAGARVDVDTRKRNPLDFALWKAAKPSEKVWPSPWGEGRPGWHIECSAMSVRYLGQRFDLHGGGMDLIFPHHENEIAQTRAVCGSESFATYWLHNGFVHLQSRRGVGEKMSKSLGNFFTMRQVCERHEAEALRLFLLGTHYRKPLGFEVAEPEGSAGLGGESTFPGLEEAERRTAYGYRTLLRLEESLGTQADRDSNDNSEVLAPADTFHERFERSMSDDFNSAAALGHVAEILTLANRLLDRPKGIAAPVRRRTLFQIQAGMRQVSEVLGLWADDGAAFLARRRAKLCDRRAIAANDVEEIIAERKQARAEGNFSRADTLRDRLDRMGIELMDRPDGLTHWNVREDDGVRSI